MSKKAFTSPGIAMLLLGLILSGPQPTAQADAPANATDEAPADTHLVRVPSSRSGEVYRDLSVPFHNYRRLLIDPVAVQFKESWRRANSRLTEAQLERVRVRAAGNFHDELVKELIDGGTFEPAETAAPDVLRAKARIIELELTAPLAGTEPGIRTFTRRAAEMLLMVDLFDAASGVLVARILSDGRTREFSRPQRIDQVTIDAETRLVYANAALLTHEALNLAVVESQRSR